MGYGRMDRRPTGSSLMRQPIGSRRIGLGLQRRIMLYVAVGLAVMLGGVAFLGLGAIDQATELVFHERLSAAHTTARILERDLGSVAAESREETQEWAVMVSTGQADAGPATALMGHTRPSTSWKLRLFSARIWPIRGDSFSLTPSPYSMIRAVDLPRNCQRVLT